MHSTETDTQAKLLGLMYTFNYAKHFGSLLKQRTLTSMKIISTTRKQSKKEWYRTVDNLFMFRCFIVIATET